MHPDSGTHCSQPCYCIDKQYCAEGWEGRAIVFIPSPKFRNRLSWIHSSHFQCQSSDVSLAFGRANFIAMCPQCTSWTTSCHKLALRPCLWAPLATGIFGTCWGTWSATEWVMIINSYCPYVSCSVGGWLCQTVLQLLHWCMWTIWIMYTHHTVYRLSRLLTPMFHTVHIVLSCL